MNALLRQPRVRLVLSSVLVFFSLLIVRFGVWPALQNTRGDFGNYYTASRLLVDGVPLRNAYLDFVWFQKQMDRYGIENQLGGFIPHPPSAALVFLPLVPFDALTAKRIWILFNVLLLVGNIVLLSRIADLHWLVTGVLLLGTGYGLLNNFLFGQQYLLLLTTLLLGIFLNDRGRPVWAGIAFGSFIPVKYVGLVYLLYFAFRRNWRLVRAALATAAAVAGATLLLSDASTVTTFFTDILPRHLRGEVQDPFAVYFQSWNSLLRRMFLYEPTLNPAPALNAAWLYFLLKNLIFWSLAAAFLLLLVRTRFEKPRDTFLFHMGLLPLAVLLLSPGSATYHFLLLAIAAVLFTKLLLDREQIRQATGLAFLFLVVNLPHFMKLRHLATGWLTPLVYTRLWFLLLFFILSVYFFRQNIDWPPPRPKLLLLSLFGLIVVPAAAQRHAYANEANDGAKWLRIASPAFNRNLGLLLKAPDVGRHKLVFTYCELLDEDYAIFDAQGLPWTPRTGQNFYAPDLAPDDSTLLVETVAHGRPEIWLSRGPGQKPAFLRPGGSPSWHPDGRHFAFIEDGFVRLASLQDPQAETISASGACQDVAFSPSGRFLVYCTRFDHEYALMRTDLQTRRETVILRSEDEIRAPCWSADERRIVFAWRVGGNLDIWAVDIFSRETTRLTSHRGRDSEPVWDAEHGRIVFASDRNRGLEFSTLYWITIPEAWR